MELHALSIMQDSGRGRPELKGGGYVTEQEIETVIMMVVTSSLVLILCTCLI